jgi:DMSO reductase family type II enzyme chaperone
LIGEENVMPDTEAQADILARECLYRFLAAALSAPGTARRGLLFDPKNQRLAGAAADLLRAEAGSACVPLGFGELPADDLDLGPLLDALRQTGNDLAAEYQRVFGLVVPRECPPYETEYHSSSEPFFRAQQLADIAGFYRAFGLDTSLKEPERPDHLALELEFMAFLLLKKRLALESMTTDTDADHASICDEAYARFFRDHLAWWIPSFATGLRRKAGTGFYAALGQILGAVVPAERGHLGIAAPRLPLQPMLIEGPEEQAGCAGSLLA